MQWLATLSIIFLLGVYYLNILNDRKKALNEVLLKEEQELINNINNLRKELEQLKIQRKNNETHNKINVSYIVNEVLDIYEQSNIRIPADILEDIAFMTFSDETEVLDFIENQRYFWRLENTKKVYKRK